jgi:hypothetical protein
LIIPTLPVNAVSDTADDGRLYGTPNSVSGLDGSNVALLSEKIHLSLSSTKLPQSIQDKVANFTAFWTLVNKDAELRADFVNNPNRVLDSYGIGEELISRDGPDINILRATLSKDIQTALVKGDYGAYLTELDNLGLLAQERKNINSLKDSIKQFMNENESLMESKELQDSELFLKFKEDADRLISSGEITPNMPFVVATLVVVAAVAVVLAVTVGAYVGAAATAAVSILAAMSVSAAVYTAVFSSTGGWQLFNEGSTDTVFTPSKTLFDQNNSSFMAMSLMDDAYYDGVSLVLNVSAQNSEIQHREVVRVSSQQSRAAIDAAVELGLLEVDETKRSQLETLIENFLLDSVGIHRGYTYD